MWQGRLLLLAVACTATCSTPILPQLQLRVLSTTPLELQPSPQQHQSPVVLARQDPIQVVFSRPVIALGSDFGGDALAPFTLSCPELGRFRWVTTSIARFDPQEEWPADLECTFTWNPELTSYDGVPLQLAGGALSELRLSTEPLSVRVSQVFSESVANLTDSLWSATLGMPDDLLPEVPEDARIQLHFNSGVDIRLLRDALKLRPEIPGLEIEVVYCDEKFQDAPLPTQEADVAHTVLEAEPFPSSCVLVRLSKPLEKNTRYSLFLPEGTRYSMHSGVVRKDTGVQLAGLRNFRLPLRADFQMLKDATEQAWDAVSSRHLRAWLPHGLSSNTTQQQLVEQLSICEVADPFSEYSRICKKLTIKLADQIEAKGAITLHVPGLRPKKKYHMSVLGNMTVMDGFNLPIQASSASFWTRDTSAFFRGPSLGSRAVAVLGSRGMHAGSHRHQWPFLARQGSQGQELQCRASAWPVNVVGQEGSSKLAALMSYGGILEEDAFSQVVSSMASGVKASKLELQLQPGTKVHIIKEECSTGEFLGRRPGSRQTLLLQADIMASILLSPTKEELFVWVTHSGTDALAQTGTVQGAQAFLYTTSFEGPPALKGSCTSNLQGLCSITFPDNKMPQTAAPVVVIIGPNGDVLYLPAFHFWVRQDEHFGPTSGALVLDRTLVVPGESLHVTGFTQHWPSRGAPGLANATLLVSPSWHRAAKKEPISVVTPISDLGSLHSQVPVPTDATPGTYSIELLVQAEAMTTQGSHASEQPTAQKQSLHRKLQALQEQGAREDVALSLVASVPLPSTAPREGFISIAMETFVVADPRPPTATLALFLPAWAKPSSPVPVRVQATSYLGDQLEGANISVSWAAGSAGGTLFVVTKEDGQAQFDVPLHTVPADKAPDVGEALTVTVQWIGPTRETIRKTVTIRLWSAAVRIIMSRSLETDLPGVPFSPVLNVIDNEDGVPIKGTTVAVKLFQSQQDRSNRGSCSEVQECSVVSGDWLPQCRLVIPCIGWYTLQACTEDASTCTSTKVGKNATEWKAEPLRSFDQPRLFASASRFKRGTVAELSLESPWGGDALVVWGNRLGQPRTMHLKLSEAGQTRFAIPFGTECEGGCTVSAITAIPGSTSALDCVPEGVRASKLFDCHSPHTHFAEVHLTQEEDKQLDVAMELGWSDGQSDPHVQRNNTEWELVPGEHVQVNTKLFLQQEVQDSEITLIAVDKAILDLIPTPLRPLTSALQPNLLSSHLLASSEADRLHNGAVDAVFDTLLRRVKENPWLPLETTVTSSCCSPVDEDDEAYLARQASIITYMPNRFDCLSRSCPREFALGRFEETLSAASESMTADKSSEGGGSEKKAGGPRLASDFVATPFFAVVRGKTVSLEAPSKLGTYILRAYAVARTGGLQLVYGQTERELLVQRKLSLIPSMPRYVRVGDSFRAGVLVAADTAGGAISACIMCSVKRSDNDEPQPVVLVPGSSSSRTLTLSPQAEQLEVQFPFTANTLGTASVLCQATIGDVAVDSLEMPLEVLQPQLPVELATSFAVRLSLGHEASILQWEGLELPQALPGSGSLILYAALGNLASIRALTRVREPFLSPSLLLLAIKPLVLAKYQQPLESGLLQNASQAVADLQRMTHEQFGLQAFLQETPWETPMGADMLLNAWACWMVSWVSATDNGAVAEQEYSQAWDIVKNDLTPSWKAALARQLVKDAESSRYPRIGTAEPKAYSDLYTLAWARLALGAQWQIPLCPEQHFPRLCAKSSAIQEDLSLSRLKAQAAEGGLASHILTALLINECKECIPEHGAFIEAAADLVISQMRVAARAAYVSAGRESQRSASYEVQALALQLLAQVSRKPEAALVQKLASHVAQQDSRQGSGISKSGPISPGSPSVRARALMVKALATYDEASGSDNPDLNITLSVAETTLLQASFTPQSLSGQAFSTNTSWEELPATLGRLAVKAEGRGEASIAALLSFVPASLPKSPSQLYRGLWLESTVRAVGHDGNPGQQVQGARLGAMLSVSIQLVSPDDLGVTILRVLLPAGLEPLDPNVNDLPRACSAAKQWWQPICPRQETRPSEVRFLYPRLEAGTHTVSFMAIAAVRGDFVAPPVKAFVEGNPEILGLTPGARFLVT